MASVRGAALRDERDAALAHDLHLLPQGWFQGQGAPKDLFAAIAAIDIGVVKGGDAQVQRGVDQVQQPGVVQVPVGQAPQAQRQARDVRAAL
jgi:hypothetical protein